MVNGLVVGIVKENIDPEGMHRVLVEYPASNTKGKVESSWARICSPMAGKGRGLVVIPDIDTEVVLCFSYRSLHPYILGGVYNGKDDKPEPYHNDDEENNIRIFWSRNDSMVVFDDTAGAEKIQFGVLAQTRLDVKSGVIWQDLDAPNKTLTEYSDGDTCWTAGENISIKCKTLEMKSSDNITMKTGGPFDKKAGGSMKYQSGSLIRFAGSQVLRNCGKPATPSDTLPSPKAKYNSDGVV